jgi:hypothetical protein
MKQVLKLDEKAIFFLELNEKDIDLCEILNCDIFEHLIS